MLKDLAARLPGIVVNRARAAGEVGEAWLAGLSDLVVRLETEWAVETSAILAGGSEALVLEARLADGRPAVLKLCLPDASGIVREAQVMKLAAGRGYAAVLAHDATSDALLLEKLGPMLADVVPDSNDQMIVLCRTMADAWLPLDETVDLTTGSEKAFWLREFISRQWLALARPCSEQLVDRAMAYCEVRAAAFDRGSAVLVHGDAHAHNALVVGEPAGAETQCKFIDPDGLIADRACDLASIMRDYNEELMTGDTELLLRRRCEQLVSLTGAEPEATWQWGYIERVSTALVLLELGMKETAALWFEVAERL